MDEILFSIIMPVYNAVSFVNDAIMSIVEQSFTNFELILVDDGSTDGSADICQKYANENENIIYIRQENNGICSARNIGMKYAKGKYIGFSDHDDIYSKDYLRCMADRIALENNIDLVRCGVSFIEELPNATVKRHIEQMPRESCEMGFLVKELVCLPSSYFTVWNCIYNKDFIDKSGVIFPEEMKHGQEDYYFNLCLMQYAHKISFIDRNLYTHYRRIGQSTSAAFYEDVVEGMAINMKLEIRLLEQYLANDDSVAAKKWVIYARKITGILFYCFRSCEKPQTISVKMMKKFSLLVQDLYSKWKLDCRILKDVFLISPKYSYVVYAIATQKWSQLAKVYKLIK